MKINIVIPMAGRGTRLATNSQGVPKPFIMVRGRPLWWWAVSGLPISSATRLVFVALAEHVERFQLAQAVATSYPTCDVRVVGLDDITDGQLCTVLCAEQEFDRSLPLAIFNGDTFIRQNNDTFQRLIQTADGVLGVASMPGDRWSFARLDGEQRVVEVAEKVRISDHACTGLYAFRETPTFCDLAKRMIGGAEKVMGEYYVSPIFNHLIANKGSVRIIDSERFFPIGTNTELQAFTQYVSEEQSA